MTPDQLATVLRLSVEDRLRLVEAIWNSILESPDPVEGADAPTAEPDSPVPPPASLPQ